MPLVEDDLERSWRHMEDEKMEYDMSMVFNIYIGYLVGVLAVVRH